MKDAGMFCRSELRLNQKAWKTIFLRVFLILKPSRLFLKHSRFELKPSRWNLSSSYLFKKSSQADLLGCCVLGDRSCFPTFLFLWCCPAWNNVPNQNFCMHFRFQLERRVWHLGWFLLIVLAHIIEVRCCDGKNTKSLELKMTRRNKSFLFPKP